MTLIEDPPTAAPALSNMEACARVVAKLAMEGFIPQRQLPTAAHAVQIPVRMIIEAVDQIARNGYRAPAQRIHTRTIVVEAQADPSAEPAAVPAAVAAKARRPDHFPDGTKTRRCKRCREHKPIDCYRYVAKGRRRPGGPNTFAFQSWCTDCHRTYQQERYISAAREAALASVGLVLNGDAVLCVICAKPIDWDGGDVADVVLTCHASCLHEEGAC